VLAAQTACERFADWEMNMAWTTPVVVELCLGMEVTSYESASL
jgi:coenzyme PQQ precursor peptide PqqA